LGQVDVVLGYEWIAELGDIHANFQRIQWQDKGNEFCIVGDPSLGCGAVSWRTALKADGEGYMITPYEVGA